MAERKEHGQNDGIRLAGGEGYEVQYFAEKHAISEEQVHELIRKHGNMRDKLDAEAEKLKSTS